MEANNKTEQPQDGNSKAEKPAAATPPGRPTQEQRRKDGRKGILFAIEMLYIDPRNPQELKRKQFRNMYWDEVMDFRYDCFKIGVMVGSSPNQWFLVAPHNIEHIEVERQVAYMEY